MIQSAGEFYPNSTTLLQQMHMNKDSCTYESNLPAQLCSAEKSNFLRSTKGI